MDACRNSISEATVRMRTSTSSSTNHASRSATAPTRVVTEHFENARQLNVAGIPPPPGLGAGAPVEERVADNGKAYPYTEFEKYYRVKAPAKRAAARRVVSRADTNSSAQNKAAAAGTSSKGAVASAQIWQ